MLWLYRRIIFGNINNFKLKEMLDLKKSEILILWALAIPILFYGFYPEPLFNTIQNSVSYFLADYVNEIQNYVVNR